MGHKPDGEQWRATFVRNVTVPSVLVTNNFDPEFTGRAVTAFLAELGVAFLQGFEKGYDEGRPKTPQERMDWTAPPKGEVP